VTIIASVKVRDGVILGTDSMTQIWGSSEQGPQLWKTYTNAQKLFQLGGLPVGVMTYGLGNIGNRSIEGVVDDFAKTVDAATRDVGAVSQRLCDYVRGKYDAVFGEVPLEQQPVLGMFVAGYSPDHPLAEEFEFVLPRDEAPVVVRPASDLGASWRGIDSPFTRLAIGIDPVFFPALEAKGLTEAEIREMTAEHGMVVVFDGMPLQDAINYCSFILDTTIGWSTFQWGAQACARPLQVATVLERSGFRWIAKPPMTVPSMDPVEGREP